MVQEEMPGKAAEKRGSTPGRNRQRPFQLKQSHIRGFVASMKENGRAEGTIKKYRADLFRFYDFLGDDKWVYSDSLPRWKQDMINAGYAERSINASIVAANNLYDYLGCWEWQYFEWMELKKSEGPDLSREEYHALLREARKQENVQTYLLIKVLACTGLTPGELYLLTREAVNEGVVTGKKRGGREPIILPEALRQELLDYAIYRSITSGPLFIRSSGKRLERSVVSKFIALIGEDAGLPAGAANPRNLRRLYLSTLEDFQRQADAWVARSYYRLLEEEEQTHGWRSR